jgi:membrane protein implicated in regulation of membrane protease activity
MEQKTKASLASVVIYVVGLALVVIGVGMCTYQFTPFPAAVAFFGILFIFSRFSYMRAQRKKKASSGTQPKVEEGTEKKRESKD